jgi:hypothetical protein
MPSLVPTVPRCGAVAALVTLLLVFALSSVPAHAVPCEDCPQEEGGGVPAGPPAPVSLTAVFRYEHGVTNQLVPIRGAEVEFRMTQVPLSRWTARTDDGGHARVEVPFTAGATYAVELVAWTPDATVLDETAIAPTVFRAEPGAASGAPIRRTSTAPGQTLDFSFDFKKDTRTARAFNIAEVIRRGAAYARSHRHPGETDEIGRAPAVMATSPSPTSWFNPVGGGTINLLPDHGFEDLAILHEYAHHLQSHIGAFPWIPSTHGGCPSWNIFGARNNSPELAWMEGFADWFAQVVDASPTGTPDVGTPSRMTLETPPDCTAGGSVFPSDAWEPHVASMLWDLFDRAGDIPPISGDDDPVQRRDTEIFQIMDRELDVPAHQGPWPQVSTFRSAWIARGLDPLGPILLQNNIRIFANAQPAPEPILEPAPIDRVCMTKRYTPGC